jgi:hypothetical protein
MRRVHNLLRLLRQGVRSIWGCLYLYRTQTVRSVSVLLAKGANLLILARTLTISLLARSPSDKARGSNNSSSSSNGAGAYAVSTNSRRIDHELNTLGAVQWHPVSRAYLKDLEKADKEQTDQDSQS